MTVNRKHFQSPSESAESIPNLDTKALDSAIHEVLKEAQANDHNSVLSVTVPYENLDPLAVLEVLGAENEFQYYWEYPEEKLAISAGRSLHKLRADGDKRFETISNAIKNMKQSIVEYSSFGHSLAGVHFLGGFSFFDYFVSEKWNRFGAACFIIPEWTFIRDGELSLLTINFKANSFDKDDAIKDCIRTQFQAISGKLLELTKNQNGSQKNGQATLQVNVKEDSNARENWVESILKAQQNIKTGRYDKIVLSRELEIELDGKVEPTRIVNHLRKEYPSCYTFLFRPDGKTSFLGSTPERLLSIRSNYILTEGLAGSISRGKTATDDTILEKQLLNSSKDIEEHNYVVRSIQERLLLFSDEVNFPKKPGIKKFTNVQHLYTPISAWMNKDYNPFSILDKMHPTPAVGGFPTNQALGNIPELELYDRGWYAGPIGWINSKGRGEFVVSIRSGIIDEKDALFYAGCGIVEHSNPDSEWEETKLKFIPMLTAIQHG